MSMAVIPARGGSKRIPRKNIVPFAGKPIIAWSIEAAMRAGIFERVIVSTDDEEIAVIGRDYGAETPFMRPHHLSDDFTGTAPVVAHAIREIGEGHEDVCCIYPAAPFVAAELLRDAAAILRSDPAAAYVVPVVKYHHPIQRAVRIEQNGHLDMADPAQYVARTQDLEPMYHDAGQFYFGRAQAWLDEVPILGPRARAIIVQGRACDIDTFEDMRRAEALAKAIR